MKDIFDSVVVFDPYLRSIEFNQTAIKYDDIPNDLPIYVLTQVVIATSGGIHNNSIGAKIHILEIGFDNAEFIIKKIKEHLKAIQSIKPLFFIIEAYGWGEVLDAFPTAYKVFDASSRLNLSSFSISANSNAYDKLLTDVLSKCQLMIAPNQTFLDNWMSSGLYYGEYKLAHGGEFIETIVCEREKYLSNCRKLKVAMLFDPQSCTVNTIREHLESFDKYSKNCISFIPATSKYWESPNYKIKSLVDIFNFDVAIVHYSVRISTVGHMSDYILNKLRGFHGFKVIFIQDEYEGIANTLAHMDFVSYNLVYTCVPLSSQEKIYPTTRYPNTEFLPTLTGYVPEDPTLERFSLPLNKRKLDIAYRGRKLPFIYGILGHEKYKIGIDVNTIARNRGLNVDIETDHDKRIYGNKWYEFIGSARATLGTESGANIFDFDGSIAAEIEKLCANDTNITFDQIYKLFLCKYDNYILMNQISPKLFEAIRLRTALILFEGTYSNILTEWVHYIPLKKDYSNIDEVFRKLEDDSFLFQLTENAYCDVIQSGNFSYETFVSQIDADLENRIFSRVPNNLLSIDSFCKFETCEQHEDSMTKTSSIRVLNGLEVYGDLVVIGKMLVSSDLKGVISYSKVKDAKQKLSLINPYLFIRPDCARNQYGFIAQELKNVLPEAVNHCDDLLSISYEPIIALLVEATNSNSSDIQEINLRLSALEAKKFSLVRRVIKYFVNFWKPH